ncbi:hypothetical protein DMP07_02390 [Slackia faecicanis]|uniref:Uncharacterized protein n=1 Tax=Slackia faecicanis TaxID=255723 RepID=A0A3N0AJK1_9ACTN|nr:hypothetical protein [Slackia faecicanis]RNL21698.1 hypothetical protein DMP07_02390 [Slackia faecicanis]
MTASFPFELDASAKRRAFPDVDDESEGRVFGLVESGIALPEGGAFYLVEFDSPVLSRARILAYVDKYGRVFETSEPLIIPPARFPDFKGFSQEGTARERGYLAVVSRIGEETAVGSYSCKDPGGNERYRIEGVIGPRVFSAPLPGPWEPYDDFIGKAYFRFVGLARERAASRPFDLGAVFARFDTTDLFDAVNREILEVESSFGEGGACDVERYLAALLRDSGIVGKTRDDLAFTAPDGRPCVPAVRLLRTAFYANTYYVDFYYADASGTVVENGGFSTLPETAEARRTFLRAEAALNRFLLLTEYLEQHFEGGSRAADEAFCSAADRWLCDRICVQAYDPAQAPLLESAWDKHLAYARACEMLRLPYRVGYEFYSDQGAASFGVNVFCPPADVMAGIAWDEAAGCYVPRDEAARNGDAARYAAHAAILFAAQAFSVSSDIERVYLNCMRDGGDEAVAAGVFERAAFCAAFASDAEHAFADPFAFLHNLGVAFEWGDEFALRAVPTCFQRGEGVFAETREPLIHRDAVPFSEEARELAGVAAPCDLTIFEDGARSAYAEEVSAALDAGVASALECLKGIHDRTENILVRRICGALMDGFMLGDLDEHSYLEVKEAFIDAYGFKPLMARATALVRADDESQAIAVLEDLLAKVEATEGFADTAQTCYRFFDSYETRYMYARHCADDAAGRRVLPLPDEAFLVHDALAQVYTTSIAGADAALEHANRCIELAPARAYSYLRAARAYFMRGEFEQEISMCSKAIEVAWHPADAGLALYWMAYAFWKLERYDAAAACYRRCAALRSAMADQAMVEFEELLQSVKGLQRHTEEEEDEILRKEGVAVGALSANCESMLDMAKAAADSGCNSLCCVMAASGARVVRDDALMPTVRSFSAGRDKLSIR